MGTVPAMPSLGARRTTARRSFGTRSALMGAMVALVASLAPQMLPAGAVTPDAGLSGQVTSQASGTPLASVRVRACAQSPEAPTPEAAPLTVSATDPPTWAFRDCVEPTLTAPDGHWSITGLDPDAAYLVSYLDTARMHAGAFHGEGPEVRYELVVPTLTPTISQALRPLSPPTMPTFTTVARPVTPHNLAYNPTGEFDFPHVLRVPNQTPNRLGEWYLYTAPHDGAGGVSVFYADRLEGPWTEHAGNPVVSRESETYSVDHPADRPHHAVSHVSTPHVLWVPEAAGGDGRFLMWFHGENSVTRVASSIDGLAWTYEGVAVAAGDQGPDSIGDLDAPGSIISSAGYARVYDTRQLGITGRGTNYFMVFTASTHGALKIRLATSDDAMTWTVDPKPLITGGPTEYDRVASPFYYQVNGRHLVLLHSGAWSIAMVEVGANLDREDWLGTVFGPGDIDNGRVASPVIVRDDDGIEHLFYESGQRGRTVIARADARPRTAVTRPLVDPPYVLTRGGEVRMNLPDLVGTPIVRINGTEIPWVSTELTTTLTVPAAPAGRVPLTIDDVRGAPGLIDSLTFVDAAPFGDVGSPSWYELPVAWGFHKAVTDGYGTTGEFRPWLDITRAEAFTMIWRALGQPSAPAPSSLTDIVRPSYYAEAADWASATGVTDGVGTTGSFGPDLPTNRAQWITIIWRTLGRPTAPAPTSLTDVPRDAYYAAAVDWAEAAGVTNGVGSTGEFRPLQRISRAEVLTMLFRASSRLSAPEVGLAPSVG
jgi:hypothetical protein